MSPGFLSVLGLWAAYWSALFAQIAHLRTIDDGVGARACGRVSTGLLILGLGLLLLAKGD